MSEQAEGEKPKKKITFTVDEAEIVTEDKELTPDEILVLAGLDPATRYLVRVKARKQESFEGKGEIPIKVHEGEDFISVAVGPTPVS
jgi:hypothetical protein